MSPRPRQITRRLWPRYYIWRYLIRLILRHKANHLKLLFQKPAMDSLGPLKNPILTRARKTYRERKIRLRKKAFQGPFKHPHISRLALPYNEYVPSKFPKYTATIPVSFLISSDLPLPIIPVP